MVFLFFVRFVLLVFLDDFFSCVPIFHIMCISCLSYLVRSHGIALGMAVLTAYVATSVLCGVGFCDHITCNSSRIEESAWTLVVMLDADG